MMNDDSPGIRLMDVQAEARRQESAERPRRQTGMGSPTLQSSSIRSRGLWLTWVESVKT